MAQCYGLWSNAILISDTPRRVVPLPSCFCRCMLHLMIVTGTKLHHFLMCYLVLKVRFSGTFVTAKES